MKSPSLPAPHVFVLRGDLRRLACDHYLVPGDARGHVKGIWWRSPAAPNSPEDPHGLQLEHDDPVLNRAFSAAGLWSHRGHGRAPSEAAPLWQQRLRPVVGDFSGRPRPWVINLNGHGHPTQWSVEGALCFVEAAAEDALRAGGHRMLPRRHRPLLGMPVVGTGEGGQAHAAGALLRDLLPALHEAATRCGVDIALVTFTDTVFAAAQALRIHLGLDPLRAVGPQLAPTVLNLARRAIRGELAVFLGAGVSLAAGLPDWYGLLDRLEATVDLPETVRQRLARLGPLDRAQFVALHLGDQLGPALVRVLSPHTRHALAHGLVAGLPVREAVTTNYDTLFEAACRGVNDPIAALPYESVEGRRRWLVKLHGCLESGQDDLVLSRESYLRYAGQRAALGGIVQALLMTRHLLFLGFSLTDDNFLRIIDEVRRALGPGQSQPRAVAPPVPAPSDPNAPPSPVRRPETRQLGTALMLTQDPVLSALWQPDIEWCAMAPEGGLAAQAAGQLEIFLDALSHRATAPQHLLDPTLKDAATPEDEALRALLSPLLAAGPTARRSAAWPLVATLLRHLGQPGDGAPEAPDTEPPPPAAATSRAP